MVKIIMHGCNGKMGQVISGLIAADPDMELVAGIDARDDGHNPYPVFTDIYKCDVAADAIIDFSAAVAVDKLLDYCVEKKLPCVLCTTGLSEAQLAKVDEAAKKVAILKSANMSLGINLMLKLLKEAAGVLANAGFDMEIVEKHHNLKVDAPSGTALALADSINLLNEAAPTEQVIKLKSLEAFSSAADGKATKIIIPSEIQSLAGLATSFKEVMTDPKREQPKK